MEHDGDARSLPPVEYEPVAVKDVLVEMKDTAELAIDLAYSAVLHRDEDLAAEVLRLERFMTVLNMRARMGIMMAARSPDDVEQLAPVLGIAMATEAISDAAADIASIVLEEMGLPEAIRAVLPEATETLVQGQVVADCPYAGETLGEIDLETATGVRVIAVRRGDDWLLNPGPATDLQAEDIAFLRGPTEAVEEVFRTLTGRPYQPPDPGGQTGVPDLERAIDMIVHMKDISELAVDLAYSSVLFDSESLAEEVRAIEVEVDAMRTRFEAWALRASAAVDDPVRLRGLIRLGTETEVISDAAIDIIEGIRWDEGGHPVVQLAVDESDEVLSRIVVDPDGPLADTRVEAGVPEAEPAMSVLAIRRPDEGWMLVGNADAELRPDDVVIAKGTRGAAAEFEAQAA